MKYIRATYILQAIGLGIVLWRLLFNLPNPVTAIGVILLLSPLFVTKNEMQRKGFLLSIFGVAILMMSASLGLYILWPVAGVIMIAIGSSMVIKVMLSKIGRSLDGQA